MKKDFKDKLIELGNRYDLKHNEKELDNIIRFGTWGEWGENYYLFLYRDFYRNSAYYGATIFLDKVDALENPVTITGLEQNGKEQVRNIFVKAALYFIMNNYQDTMAISGNAKSVFTMAKDLINTYIGENKPSGTGLEQFEYNLINQEVLCTELEVIVSEKKYKSRELEENLKKLKVHESPSEENGEIPKNIFKLGLCLTSRHVDLSGDLQIYFQPVIIPIKENSRMTKPQKLPKSDCSDYEFIFPEDIDILKPFLTSYQYIEAQPGSPRLKTELMNHMFFRQLADGLFALPDELTFYQPESNRDFLPLKKAAFKRIMLRFAPSLKKDYLYNLFLTFYTGDGKAIDVKDNFEIILFGDKLFIQCEAAAGDTWFIVPDSALDDDALLLFNRFFDFLAAQKEGFYSNELDTVVAELTTLESEYIHILSEPLKKYELHFLPIPILNLYPEEEELDKSQRLEIEFDYQEQLNEFIAINPDKVVCSVPSAKEFEEHCRHMLNNDSFLIQQMDYHKNRNSVFHYYCFRGNDFMDWLIQRGRHYMEKGFKIYSTKWKRFIANPNTTVKIQVSQNMNWLEFKPYIDDPATNTQFDIQLNEEEFTPGAVIDKNGLLHLVSGEEIDRLADLYRFAEQHENGFRIPTRNYVLIQKLYNKRMESLPAIKEALKSEEKLKEFEHIPDYPLGKDFNGQLRGYQMEGFKWLNFLREFHFSGCLADDMGLGKTVQTLALLHTLKESGQLKTSLLVVPVSAIPNWESEIRRFSPSLSYQCHIGPNRDKSTTEWSERDIIITSYATMRNDIEILEKFEFDYIILDESQNIKNFSSQVSQAAKLLNGRNRLALSGTPIENSTMELWSLFDFLMPGFLGTYRWFNRQLAQGIEKDHNPEKTELLKKMIFPFILRRKKHEVEKDLPEKVEIVSTLQMDDQQARLYAETALYYREKLDKEIEAKGVSGASIQILEGMLRLRQICLFPQLVDEKHSGIPSAKFDHFKELLEEILAEDHKVLIFSQFVQVLKNLKEYCGEEKLVYSYLDGSTKVDERKRMINQFQEDENNRVFLLSLKAGGVALNLTAADYVIIFDPWWNPAVEAQAIDRSHRIGQTKKVMVYRMVVKDSIEEKMLILQDKKKALVDNLIVSDSQSFKDLSRDDVLDLFK